MILSLSKNVIIVFCRTHRGGGGDILNRTLGFRKKNPSKIFRACLTLCSSLDFEFIENCRQTFLANSSRRGRGGSQLSTELVDLKKITFKIFLGMFILLQFVGFWVHRKMLQDFFVEHIWKWWVPMQVCIKEPMLSRYPPYRFPYECLSRHLCGNLHVLPVRKSHGNPNGILYRNPRRILYGYMVFYNRDITVNILFWLWSLNHLIINNYFIILSLIYDPNYVFIYFYSFNRTFWRNCYSIVFSKSIDQVSSLRKQEGEKRSYFSI